MYKLVSLSLLALAAAVPAPQRNSRGGQQRPTAQQQAARVPMGISQAQDGSMILDDMVMVKYVWNILRLVHWELDTNTSITAAYQFASRSLRQRISSW